jgi:hypothetical protein
MFRSRGVNTPSQEREAAPTSEGVPVCGSPDIWWAPSQLNSAEGPDQWCPPEIDITGRSRFLVYGPYVSLAAGIWRASVKFELCQDAARSRFTVHFGEMTSYASAHVPFGAAGQNLVDLEHTVLKPAPCEVRIQLNRAAFHGMIKVKGVWLWRRDLP